MNAIRDSLSFREQYPERIKFNDLEANGFFVLARMSERTEFSAHPKYNTFPTKLGFPVGKIHKLVSDVQLAICTAFYNSEAIRFEKSQTEGTDGDSTATKVAEGIQGKGALKGLEKRDNAGPAKKGLGG